MCGISFQISWVNTRSEIAEAYGKTMFSFCKKLPTGLPKWLYYLAFLPTMNESPCCTAFLPEIGIVSFLDCSHSDRCVVFSHFNLHFPNEKLCGTSFHMLTCHLYIFSGEACSDIFFLNWFVCFLIAPVFESSLYIWIQVQICVLQIFSPRLWFVFSFS